MPSHITLSSNRQDWQTPGWFLDLVRRVGPIALDPCTTPDNPTRAWNYHSLGNTDDCGLYASWARNGLAFINPPYGAHLSGPVKPDYEHTRKCTACCGGMDELASECPYCQGTGRIVTGRGRGWAERIAQDGGEWIALVPARTETKWWKRLYGACDWAVLWSSPVHGSRIKFVNPDTGKEQAGSNLASTVFYRGLKSIDFVEAFGPHGTLIRCGT